MTTPQEAAVIKAQLQYRWNAVENCWEIYTALLGSKTGKYRWHQVAESTKDWYLKKFPKIVRAEDVPATGTCD